MSTSVALLDTTQYVKVNSERHYVMLQSLRDTVRVAFSDTQPVVSNIAFHTLDGSDEPLRLHDIDTDVWVLAMTNRSSLVITEFDTQTIHVYPPEVDLENGYFEELEPDYAYGWIDHMDKTDNPRTVGSFATNDASPRLDRKVFPTTSGDFFIASDNAADTSIEFTCSCIAANGDALTLIATTDATDGTTPVQFGSGLDINFVVITGQDQTPIGDIYFTNLNDFTGGQPNTVTSVLAHVPVDYGCSPQSLVRVPNNRRLIIKKFYISHTRTGGSVGSAVIQLRTKRANGSEVVSEEWKVQTGFNPTDGINLVYEAGSIIEFVVKSVSDTDHDISAKMLFIYEEV